MTLNEMATELTATVLCGTAEQLNEQIATAAAGDLMSDILARVGTPDVLLTGLATNQAIRTSAVAGIRAVAIVRGKPIAESFIELAREEDIVLMKSDLSLFDASGLLYAKGVRSVIGAA